MSPAVKRRHQLAEAKSVESFVTLLAREGIEVETLVARFCRPDPPVGVLLVGSLPDGTGTPESDVDLMILHDDTDQVQTPADALLYTASRGRREFIEYPNGIEVNLEFVSREGTRSLIKDFVAAAPALYHPEDVKSLPMFEEFDLRFLHRLRSGWVLGGAAVVERWRDELMIELLPVYTALRNYVLFQRYLEDALSMKGRVPGAVGHVGRIAIEFGLHSVVGYLGFTGQNRKFLLHYCRSVQDPAGRRVIDAGQSLLFPPPVMSADEEQVYLRDLTTFGQLLEELYQRDPELGRGIRFLGSKIHQIES